MDGHRSNDFKPYVLKSTDFGHVGVVASDLPDGGSVQVIREHPRQPNLLFVGTEFGVYTTIDSGAHWIQLKAESWRAVHDLQSQARMNDLVVRMVAEVFVSISPLEHLAQARSRHRSRSCSRFATNSRSAERDARLGMGTSGFHRTGDPELGARIAYGNQRLLLTPRRRFRLSMHLEL